MSNMNATEAVPPEKSLLANYEDVFHAFLTTALVLVTTAGAASITSATRSHLFLLEFGILVVPLILSVSIAAYYIEILSVAALLTLLLLFKKLYTKDGFAERTLGDRPHCLTLLRSNINIVTSVCILAVDFQFFPYDFMKTDTFGCGFMDAGIGLFVFCMGAVSKPLSDGQGLRKMLRTVIPILGLGLLRTVVIGFIGYHQDEKEYGAHLNAFFILGFSKLFGTLISYFLNTNRKLISGSTIIAILHEISLKNGLYEFVMSPETNRDTLITANREGIVSIPGFVALFLLSLYIGNLLTSKNHSIKSKLLNLLIISYISWASVLLLIADTGISRRVANLAYLSWIISMVATMLLLFILEFDIILLSWLGKSRTEERIPVLLESINYNGLVFFLLSNILTGGVNIFLSPNARSDFESLLILILYMFIVCSVVRFMHKRKIKIA